jgi:hypothetical protein
LNGRPLAIFVQQYNDASGGNPKVGWSPRKLATRFNQAVSFHYLETNIKVLLIDSSELGADSIGAQRFIRGRGHSKRSVQNFSIDRIQSHGDRASRAARTTPTNDE